MDNNNSIPYGTISWDNEDGLSQANQQRESQRTLNTTGGNHNGLRYSLRGQQFPQPRERLEGVGLSRQIGIAVPRQGQLQTPQLNFQQPSTPSSSSSSNIQHERFFSLRPVLNTPQHVQIESTEQLVNNPSNPSTAGQTFSVSCPNSLAESPGNSNNSVSVSSSSQIVNFSAAAVSLDNVYNNNNNNVEVLQVLGDRRTKRKSSFSETEESQDGPAIKQFLSEERMAARMHNLRISNDHNYPVNIMQCFMDHFVTSQAAAGSSKSQFDDADDEFENNDENTEERQSNMPVFIMHPGVKDALNESQANSIIPEAIYKQLSNPCMAVIPWKNPDERFNVSTERKPEDQVKNENDLNSSSSSSSCVSVIMENIPETEQFQDKGVHHVEIIGECSTFSLEDDEMEQ